MHLVNLTSYAAHHTVIVDNNGKERLVVIVKATYTLANGQAMLDEEQEEICSADLYHGDPVSSSLRHSSESLLFKPATDVLFVGSGYARSRKQTMLDFSLQVGQLRKRVRIFGDRRWEGRPGAERISEPLPFERMPMIFEKAFGGIDDSDALAPEAYRPNPVGIGYFARSSKRPVAGTSLPNLEDPKNLIKFPLDRPAPAGTGFIAPSWEPRYLLAGTYDERWQRERMPFLPDDFSPRFYQSAPADQIYPGYLKGGEPVVIESGFRTGPMRFTLPEQSLDVEVLVRDSPERIAMLLDTVVIDGDVSRLKMTWRGNISVHNRIYHVQWVRIAVQNERLP